MIIVYMILSLVVLIPAFFIHWTLVVGYFALGFLNVYLMGRHENLFGLYRLYDNAGDDFGLGLYQTGNTVCAVLFPIGFFFSLPQFIHNIGKIRKQSIERKLRSPRYLCPNCQRAIAKDDDLCPHSGCYENLWEVKDNKRIFLAKDG